MWFWAFVLNCLQGGSWAGDSSAVSIGFDCLGLSVAVDEGVPPYFSEERPR